MVPAFELDEIVRYARARTGVPGVAAGAFVDGRAVAVADGVCELGRDDPVRSDTPFRIASISKPFTASLALSCLEPDARLRGWLSHTSGLRSERAEPLPDGAHGLFSYSNAGYWAAGEACAAACRSSFTDAMGARILAPLGLTATGYGEPRAPARGHVQEGETGHRAVPVDAYPVARRRLRPRLVGARRGRPGRARPRRLGRGLPVAALARAGGAVRARGADEQLARERARAPRRRAARARCR